MSYYRLPNLDLSTRIDLALQMVDPSRPWGLVTDLARKYQVSRKFLYQQRDKAEAGLVKVLAAQPPGPKAESTMLTVNREHLQRSIVTLATAVPASIWGIQVCLEEVLGTHRSTGFISQTLKQAGEAASQQNRLLAFPQPVLGEADEIFQGCHPCLTVVDGHSFAVIYLSPQESRDATTWGVSFLEIQEQGTSFQDMACDGAKGIRYGMQQAGLSVPLRPDLFHLLQEANALMQRLERKAYKVMEWAYRSQRVEAQAREEQTIDRYDWFVWLHREIRGALEPWTRSNRLTSAREAHETLETAIALLRELGDADIDAYARKLLDSKDELLAPLVWLEEQLVCHRQRLAPDVEAAIIWAYRHRAELSLENPGEGFPSELHPVVKAFWQALSNFHRSSSLAESLHSWLRPYFQAHRGMPEWLTPLLQLYWNHHTFQRGKRKGKTPLSLAGIDETTSWSQVLECLFVEPKAEAA